MIIDYPLHNKFCCRSKDLHLPLYPMKILFVNEHNHYLHCANNVRHKDVSEETRKKILDLFESGHSPYSALDVYKMDLKNAYREDYYKVAADRSLCPDLQWCYRFVVIHSVYFHHFHEAVTVSGRVFQILKYAPRGKSRFTLFILFGLLCL